jgi:hypothetical protein
MGIILNFFALYLDINLIFKLEEYLYLYWSTAEYELNICSFLYPV